MISIAVLGYGTVGSGVVEVIEKNKEVIDRRAGEEIRVKYILDLRDFPGDPYADRVVHDMNVILQDPEVSIICETMGGNEPAFTYSMQALKAGKSVCTSNKELVANHGAELIRTAKENSCNYLFEASVGGGIPIIRPLHQCLAANKFERISGILNGTTNYILTKMIYDQVSFDDALKQAQELGYAEKDPTADVDGHDATRKLCILGSLAFGKHIYPEYVHCSGIRNITLDDVEYAEDAGYAIKLVGLIENTDSGLVATVCPRLVSVNNPLSSVNDVFNAIMVTGDAVGDVLFYGRGAGKFPTASAVVADIIDAIKHEGRDMITLNWEDSCDRSFIRPYKSAKVSMYVRISAENVDSLKATITGMFGYVDFIPRKHRSKNELAFITPVMQESEIDRRLGILSQSAQLKRKIRLL